MSICGFIGGYMQSLYFAGNSWAQRLPNEFFLSQLGCQAVVPESNTKRCNYQQCLATRAKALSRWINCCQEIISVLNFPLKMCLVYISLNLQSALWEKYEWVTFIAALFNFGASQSWLTQNHPLLFSKRFNIFIPMSPVPQSLISWPQGVAHQENV